MRLSTYNSNDYNFVSLLPRLSLNYKVLDNFSLKTYVTKTMQTMHIATETWNGSPNNSWIAASKKLKPEIAWITGIGAAWQPFNSLAFSIDAYYKHMNNLIDYKSKSFVKTDTITWSDVLDVGTGKVYELELSARYNTKKIKGMINYTLSRSTRQFDSLNYAEPFRYFYDRTHELSISIIYQLTKHFSLSSNWVFSTGHPFTLNNIYKTFDFKYPMCVETNSKVNNYQMPNYHRLDIGLHFEKSLRLFSYRIDLGVYNAYNRKNAYELWEGGDHFYAQSLFGLLPYINLGIKF